MCKQGNCLNCENGCLTRMRMLPDGQLTDVVKCKKFNKEMLVNMITGEVIDINKILY